MNQWILLRGLTRETRHWGAFESSMRAHGVLHDDDRAVFIDLPGNGDERTTQVPLSVHAMMDHVRARAVALGVTMPCRVLAMSLGAMVATAWAQQHPGEFERLVLINTSMRPFARVDERLRVSAWPTILRIAAHWNHPERCERLIHALTCHRTDTFDTDISEWAALKRTHGAGAGNALRQLYAAARFQAQPSAPLCPTLILSSQSDRLVDSACSERIAKQWRAKHAIHPWSGHDLPHDDAAWTCEAIATWLADMRSTHAIHAIGAHDAKQQQ
jgi:pimeloyl-ACP methyl ester carboxylesterase